MKKTLLLLFCIASQFIQSQQTISGTFSPAEDYSWLIAYRLKPGSQAYVADTSIKEGKFTLEIPESALPGTYRLVYAVPQEEFYFDVVYSGKESINFDFKSETGPLFSVSTENILFGTYFNEIHNSEQELINFYASGKTNKAEASKLMESIDKIQKSYEIKSQGLLAENFIKANHPYIPSEYLTAEEYIENKNKDYFNNINFENPVLQGSEFLTNKLANFIFTALPPKELSDSETENAIQENVKTAAKEIQNLSKDYQFHLFHSVWEYASELQLNKTADLILNDRLKPNAKSEENKEKLRQIEVGNRLRIGQIPPEIAWQSSGELKKLSTLEDASNYILIFWSSTCSHCLKELPALHKELKNKIGIKIIAIGLEDDELNWKIESEKLDSFEHAIALGRWESSYAQLYDIHSTPTYFILDDQKRIVAKPESDKAVVEFLERF